MKANLHLHLFRNIGYTIHPSMSSRLPPNPVIAVVCHGNGAYLRQLVASYPSASFECLDFKAAHRLPPAGLLGRVNLILWDANYPLPEDRYGRFDFIHVRIIMSTVIVGGRDRLLQDLVKMLRPAGGLQWEECNLADAHYFPGPRNSSCSSVRSMAGLYQRALANRFPVTWRDPIECFRAAGLWEVSYHAIDSGKELTLNAMDIITTWIRTKGVTEGHVPADTVAIENMLSLAYSDVWHGSYCVRRMQIFGWCKPWTWSS